MGSAGLARPSSRSNTPTDTRRTMIWCGGCRPNSHWRSRGGWPFWLADWACPSLATRRRSLGCCSTNWDGGRGGCLSTTTRPSPVTLFSYWPPAGGGAVLVTSRNPAWGATTTPFQVDVLARDEAVAFLRARTRRDDPAGELAAALGDLPLALEQAAAYLEQTRTSLRDYLGLLHDRAAELLGLGEPSGHPDTVATTWALSLARVQTEAPAAVVLLTLCSFLAPDDIPRDLPANYPRALPGPLRAVVSDRLAYDQVLRTLSRYSLVTVTEDGLAIHRLVQTWARETLDEQTKVQRAQEAVRLALAAFPADADDARAWPTCARLLAHGLAAADHASRLAADPEATAGLLNHVATYLWWRAELGQARQLFERALALYVQINRGLGEVSCLVGLGDVAWMQSRYSEAEKLYGKALGIAKEVFDDRGEADCMVGLGHVEFLFRRYDAAADFYLQALTLYRRLSHRRGEANAIRALGEVDRIRGCNDQAERRFEEALAIYQAIGHRRGEADAIRRLGHLARVLGMYELATNEYQIALHIYQEIGHRWGQAGCIEGLGDVDLAYGRYEHASAQYEAARELSRAVGDRKGEASATRALGDTAWLLGRYEDAAECYAKAREIAREIGDGWGEAASMRDQGDAAWMVGRFDQARVRYHEALERSQQIGDRWGEADTVQKLGNVAWKLGGK